MRTLVFRGCVFFIWIHDVEDNLNLSFAVNHDLEGAINYTRKVWGDLLAYLDEPYLELSNNLAERCVKPFVINRKAFQTSGSEAGAIYTVKLFSIIRTAIINGLDPYRYVKYVLENIKNKPVDGLLPYSKAMGKLL